MKTIVEKITIDGKEMVIYEEYNQNIDSIIYGWHLNNKWGNYSVLTAKDKDYLVMSKAREREQFIKQFKDILKHDK